MKTLNRIVLTINLLAFSLNSFAVELKRTAVTKERAQLIVKSLSESGFGARKMHELYMRVDHVRSDEVLSLFKGALLPPIEISLDEQHIKAKISGTVYNFEIFSGNEMDISNGNQKITISYTMSISQMLEKIERELISNRTVLNFIIDDANAFLPIALAVGSVGLGLFGMLMLTESDEFNADMKERLKKCLEMDSSELSFATMTDLTASYNNLSNLYFKMCVESRSQSRAKGCHSLSDNKKCFKQKIALIEKGAIKNNNRAKERPSFEYNAERDIFYKKGTTR